MKFTFLMGFLFSFSGGLLNGQGFTPEELSGRINASRHHGFVRAENKYTSGRVIYLRREAYEAFEKMAAAARLEGIVFKIISGFRSFEDQKSIWEAKWTGRRTSGGENFLTDYPEPVSRARAILKYSSMPGTSRHHWGTDLDLNSLENRYFESGQGKKVYLWLLKNAPRYGFCQPYTQKGPDRPAGYEEEKWHWSYIPLSKPMLKSYLNLEMGKNIRGFLGSETARQLEVEKNFVLGIDFTCR